MEKKKSAPKKAAAPKSVTTKSGLIAHLAQTAGIERKQAEAVLDGLVAVARKELKGPGGQFKIPDLVKLVVKIKPATGERQGRNPKTGETMTIAAKPARRVLKGRVLKSLTDSVL